MGTFSWVFCIIFLWYTLCLIFRSKKRNKVMLVLGSGGHTTEILRLMELWPGPICAVHASTDTLSRSKFISNFNGDIYSISRSRSVGQSYFTSIFTTLYSFVPAIWTIIRSSPDLLITNGPGTALPICYSAFFYKLVSLKRIKIVFVESFCRTHTLSLAGKLIYPIANEFYVQWETLQKVCPKAKYIGLLS